MKIIQKLIIPTILTTLIILATSCSVEKRAQRHFNKAIALNPNLIKTTEVIKEKDSTVFKYKDSTIITKRPAEELSLNLDNLCDSLGKLKNFKTNIKTGRTKLDVSAKDGVLVINCHTDSLESVIKTLESDKQIYKEAYESKKEVINTPKKFSFKEFIKHGLIFNLILLVLFFGGKFLIKRFI